MDDLVILHSPSTLLHHSVEIIGHKLIDAHESPDRIDRILKSLEHAQFKVKNEAAKEDIRIPPEVHDVEYIGHLKGIFQQFSQAGLVEEGGCVLPECFPHRSLLQFPQSSQNLGDKATEEAQKTEVAAFRLPRDPFAHLGHYSFDMSSGISEHTYKSAMAATHIAAKGAFLISSMTPSYNPVLVLTRPPGHHACHSLAGGYCYINSIAVAAEYLLAKLGSTQLNESQSRVVILDLDFHHGNGTQQIFYSRREPAYISIHGEGEYPYYTGFANEQGHGEGLGFNRNLPLPAYPASTRQDYFDRLNEALSTIRNDWKPNYLLISMGFDTFRKDPLGGFDLDVDDYRLIGKQIRELGLPVLALLEGGYSNELGDLVVEFLKGLKGE